MNKLENQKHQKKIYNEINHTYNSVDALHKEIINNHIHDLFKSSDNYSKLRIRKEISKISPIDKTLLYLSNYYNNHSDGIIKLHIGSIISQINPIGYEFFVEDMAKETEDESLFVHYIYSLKNAKSNNSKKSLLRLLESNILPKSDTSLQMNKQGFNAIRMALLDTIIGSDFDWIDDFTYENNLTDTQINIIVESMSRYPSYNTLDFLERTMSMAHKDELKYGVEKEFNRMKERLEYNERKKERMNQF